MAEVFHLPLLHLLLLLLLLLRWSLLLKKL